MKLNSLQEYVAHYAKCELIAGTMSGGAADGINFVRQFFKKNGYRTQLIPKFLKTYREMYQKFLLKYQEENGKPGEPLFDRVFDAVWHKYEGEPDAEALLLYLLMNDIEQEKKV